MIDNHAEVAWMIVPVNNPSGFTQLNDGRSPNRQTVKLRQNVSPLPRTGLIELYVRVTAVSPLGDERRSSFKAPPRIKHIPDVVRPITVAQSNQHVLKSAVGEIL